MVVIIVTLLLLFFLLTGMPIAFAMGVSGSIGLIVLGGLDYLLGIIQMSPRGSTANYLFTTIPMFIFMAELLTSGRFSSDLFDSANKWFSRLPAGLGIATVLAGAGLGAVSGSTTASAATLSSSAVPEMLKNDYKKTFALGVTSISGTLAGLIPPSIGLILYGILTNTGIGALLIAGIIPGIVTVVGYVITILIWTKIDPSVAPRITEVITTRDRFKSLIPIWPLIIIMLAVIGGIYFGVVTPTEAGGLGAFATFVIALIMGRLTFKSIQSALKRTLRSTTMIMTIMIGAMIFGYFMISTQLAQKLIISVNNTGLSSWSVLLIVIIIYLFLGMFMDQVAIAILTLPLTFPLMMSYGFDPIWFGIIFVKTAEIGLVTPPVGINVFVAAGVAKEKPTVAFKGVTSFIIAEFIILIILCLFPMITTWLPSIMYN